MTSPQSDEIVPRRIVYAFETVVYWIDGNVDEGLDVI
jgi:hypothetical protein